MRTTRTSGARRSASPVAGRTPAGAAFTAVVLEVFRVNGDLLAAGNALCEGTGLTSARWQVLGAVAMPERAPTVAQIARVMGQTRQGVQRIVDELEREGVVERTADPEHARARPVRLTEQGAALWAEMRRRQVPWANRAGEAVGAAALESTLETLRAIRAHLEGDERRE